MNEDKFRNLLTWRIAILAKRIQDGEPASIDVHQAVSDLEELMDSKEKNKVDVEELERLWEIS